MYSLCLALTMVCGMLLPHYSHGQDKMEVTMTENSAHCENSTSETSSSSDSNSCRINNVACDGYEVSVMDNTTNGVCTTTMNISGNGINKMDSWPCKENPDSLVAKDGWITIGDYLAHSKTPGVLFKVIKGKEEGEGQCYKEVFLEDGDEVRSSRQIEVVGEECKELETKMKEIKDQKNYPCETAVSSSGNSNDNRGLFWEYVCDFLSIFKGKGNH